MKNTLYILILFLLPLHAFAEETLEQKVRNILNDKSIAEPYDRWKVAYDSIGLNYRNLSYEEAMLLYTDILLPFADKEVRNTNLRYQAQACIYRQISHTYKSKGQEEDQAQSDLTLKKAIEYAELSANDTIIADFYEQYAQRQIQNGSVQLAHDYLYKAIKLYESIEQYNKISMCLYSIAINLLQTRDIAALRKVIEQMQQNIENQSSTTALYSLYAVQSAYYSILTEDFPENAAFKDSSLWVSQNKIHLIENRRDELSKRIVFAWDYYNMAFFYEKVYPDSYDSVYYFLNKALVETEGRSKNTIIEVEISVYTLYAELHFKQKNYEQAEKDMLHALSLLEQVQDNNTVVVEFSETYKFLAKYYETVNRPAEALKYHKLLLENEAKRYDSDKIAAMDDMLVKYETEKKEVQIETLTKEKQAAHRILLLTVSLIAMLLIALLIFIRFYQLRRKNLQQSIYEAALLAELKQNELEQNLQEKERLQKQYDRLEKQAARNKEKAESYNAELTHIKQQLEQKPTKAMADKLSDWVSKSPMRRTNKDNYLRQLSELDVEMLERGFLSARDKISNMDMKYIICFAIDMEVQDMSLLFNVEPASIYTVRYRIKKKFGGGGGFRFLI